MGFIADMFDDIFGLKSKNTTSPASVPPPPPPPGAPPPLPAPIANPPVPSPTASASALSDAAAGQRGPVGRAANNTSGSPYGLLETTSVLYNPEDEDNQSRRSLLGGY